MKKKQISDRRTGRMFSDKIDVKHLKNKTFKQNAFLRTHTYYWTLMRDSFGKSVARLGSLEISLFVCQRALPGVCPGPSTWAPRISNLARCCPSLIYHPLCLALSRALWMLFQLGVQKVDGFMVLPGDAASWAISLCLQGLLIRHSSGQASCPWQLPPVPWPLYSFTPPE